MDSYLDNYKTSIYIVHYNSKKFSLEFYDYFIFVT